jgi:hypothetical protein
MLLKALTLRLREWVLEMVAIFGLAGATYLALKLDSFARVWRADDIVKVTATMLVLFAGWTLVPFLVGVFRRLIPGEDVRKADIGYDVLIGFGAPLIYLTLSWAIVWGLATCIGAEVSASNRRAAIILTACGLSFIRTFIAGLIHAWNIKKQEAKEKKQ